jgi:hypothetical protein
MYRMVKNSERGVAAVHVGLFSSFVSVAVGILLGTTGEILRSARSEMKRRSALPRAAAWLKEKVAWQAWKYEQ